jgi:hypothetical protein
MPIANPYDSSGNVVAYAKGVSLSGKTWDVYIYKSSSSSIPQFA